MHTRRSLRDPGTIVTESFEPSLHFDGAVELIGNETALRKNEH